MLQPLTPVRAARLLILAARSVGTLQDLGGRGSGNFGHAGRPGQVGGSASEGERTVDERGITHVGKFIELYHGTSRRRANKIAREGFRIRAVKQQTMGGDPESSRDYVWFAKTVGDAKLYSEMHENPVIVTVRIPESLFDRINPYGRNSGPKSVWSKEAIPAKYIHSVTALRDLGGRGSGNFGHAGRPGQVGGSAASGAGGAEPLPHDLVLHHSSPYPNIPSFSAFFGGADFEQTFGEHEFGEYRYEATLPKGTLVLDLNQDTSATREFKAALMQSAWPNDKALHEQARTEPNFDVYEEWTDKDNIVNALYGLNLDNVVVKYQDEYLIPKSIIMRIPVARTLMSRVSRTLGGRGSGNFGHAGRPGQVGGSSSDDVGPATRNVLEALRDPGGNRILYETNDYRETRFILPDGTRIGHTQDYHQDAALQIGVDLNEMMAEGIIRYTPGVGAEVSAPITRAQAQHIIDGSYAVPGDTVRGSLYVDVFWGGQGFESKGFDDRATADTIRNWVNSHFVKARAAGLTIDLSTGRLAAGFDPNQARDDQGQWTDTGASLRLQTEAKHGIEAMTRLLPQALKGAEYDEESQAVTDWSDVDSEIQSKVYVSWFDGQMEDADWPDDTDIINDFERDLRRDPPDEFIADVERDTLASLEKTFVDPTQSTLPLDEPLDLVRRIDPETLVYDEDDGDVAPLDTSQLRFQSGEELTEREQQQVADAWNAAYREQVQKSIDAFRESDSYSEQITELQNTQIDEKWKDLSDQEKFAVAADEGIEIEGRAIEISSPATEPDRWVSGVTDGSRSDENYAKTRAIAKELTFLRTQELIRARALGDESFTTDHIESVWGHWKGSSTSPMGLALQYASAQEFNGVHRLTEAQILKARTAAQDFGDGDLGMKRLQAYVRAQWETTQFVMEKSGESTSPVYRAIWLDKNLLTHTPRELTTFGGYDYTKLPEVKILRGGAQSTTGTVNVANDWGGVGDKPPDAERVVLRIDAPRTSVLSLPVYGDNEQGEHEVVLIGTKDRWTWDAWLRRAPTFKFVPMTQSIPALKAAARRKVPQARKSSAPKRIVIDLQKIDEGKPHWLTGLDGGIARSQREGQVPLSVPKKRTLGGPGSGNFGHAGRPGEVGGSAPSSGGVSPVPSNVLEAIHLPDGGFTYNPVTGEQPTTGFALSVHPERAAVMNDQQADVIALAEFAVKNWDLLSQDGNFIGGWHDPDDGKVYLDVSTVVKTAEEAERLGRDANQIAYFDLVKGQSIKIKPHVKAAATYFESHGSFVRPSHVAGPYRAREAFDGPRSDTGRNSESRSRSRPSFRYNFITPTSRLTTAGGPGSGNFGHAGRPGQVGGSADTDVRLSRRTGQPMARPGWLDVPDAPTAEFRKEVGTTAEEMRAKPLPKTLADAEDQIRYEPNEHAFLSDGNTPRQYFGDNLKDAIKLDPTATYTDAVFTHNHPGDMAFSRQDVYTAMFHNMREIRAVTSDGAYSLKRVGIAWPSAEVVNRLSIEEGDNVRKFFERRIAEGKLTIAEANRQHWTAVWIRVQERLRQEKLQPIDFSFEPRAKKAA